MNDKNEVHHHFDPVEILNDYNNGRGPFVKRSIIEWSLILGYLHCEFDIYSAMDKKNGTTLSVGIIEAINDVRRFMREQCSEPTLVCFDPEKLHSSPNALN